MKKIFLLLFVLFFTITPAFADDYHQTTYNVEYTPINNDTVFTDLKINIKNPRSDIFIKEYALLLPENFSISDLSVKSNFEIEQTKSITENKYTKIIIDFKEPKEQLDNRENNIFITYKQKNIFKKFGNIYELTIPAISSENNITFNVVLNFNSEKITLAKPKPTLISGGKIYWNDIKERAVYAIFGNSQNYEVNLDYHLKNDELTRVYTDIALPPETLYQKNFVNKINPMPEMVYLDEDGNYLARYSLNPKETKNIKYNGFIQLFTQANDDYINTSYNKIDNKNYLLTAQPYWKLGNNVYDENIKNIKTPQEIYNYVTQHLSYSYLRVNTNLKRLGAEEIMANPKSAVCMEFTDLFVAIAREKGIRAREVNGYGFSNEPEFRPAFSSLANTDVLHAWPEYYDEKKQMWIQIDPTWENTSGIDYFNSLDLNHIAFTIHGKNSTYPISAGMYKTEKTKDVELKIAETLPKEKFDLKITSDIKSEIYKDDKNQGIVTIKNLGNTFIKNKYLDVKTNAIQIDKNKLYIDLLAPYQQIDFKVSYAILNYSDKVGSIEISYQDNPLFNTNIKFYSKYQDYLNKSLGFAFGLFIILIAYFIVVKKRK